MNKKQLAVCAAVCMIFSLGLVRISYGWLVDTNVSVPVNSHNRGDEIRVGDGRYTDSSGSNSNNKYDNRQDRSMRYDGSFNTSVDNRNFSDNRQDRSVKDSFNDSRDMSDHRVDNSITDSHNQDFSTTEVTSGTKRVDSSDFNVAGNVRNSVLGNFNQTYSGTDLRSGVNGSGNTIDATSVNLTTFGDTSTGAAQ